MALHLTGTALIGVSTTRQALRLRRLARASRSRLEPEAGEQYRNLAIALGVYRIPPVAVSDEVHAPMAFGFKAASIMLPPRILAHLNAEELKAVLAHELAHCQRGDLWLNWIQLMLLAVWWFHPVAWMVHRSLRDAREDCCDDLLLARGLVDNDSYCDVLLRAARELCPGCAPNAALALTRPAHPLARRLARITDWDLQRHERISLAGAIMVLFAAAVLFPGVRSRNLPAEVEAGRAASRPAAAQAETVVPAPVPLPAAVPIPREHVLEGRQGNGKSVVKIEDNVMTSPIPRVAIRSGAAATSFRTARVTLSGVRSNWRPGARAIATGAPSRTPNRTARSGARAVVRLGPYLVPPVPGHALTDTQASALAAWGVVDRRM